MGEGERKDIGIVADALTALVLLVLYLFIGYSTDAEMKVVAVILGCFSTFAFEYLGSRPSRYNLVRSFWKRKWVKYSSLVIGVVLAVLSLEFYTSHAVSFFGSALATYLVLFLGVKSGIVPKPQEW